MKRLIKKHMKRNKLILLATSVTLVSCISILSRYSGTGEWPTLKEMELKGEDGEEGEAEHGIQGAIESFYSMRLNEGHRSGGQTKSK
jgi:hypothetical protein